MVRIYGKANLSELEKLDTLYSELQKKESKKKIVYVDASSSTIVPAGSTETIVLQPPAGKIWRIITQRVVAYAPSGATTGSHRTFLGIQGLYEDCIYQVIANYNVLLAIPRLFPSSYTSVVPSDQSAFVLSVINARGSYDYPLQMTYYNLTDADQTATRYIKLIFEEEDEAS